MWFGDPEVVGAGLGLGVDQETFYHADRDRFF